MRHIQVESGSDTLQEWASLDVGDVVVRLMASDDYSSSWVEFYKVTCKHISEAGVLSYEAQNMRNNDRIWMNAYHARYFGMCLPSTVATALQEYVTNSLTDE